MERVTKTKRAKRIAGIGEAAREFSVTRQHLGLVIRGHRTSPKLLKKFRTWQSARRSENKTLSSATGTNQ
jgi:hypothetical protein